MTEEARLIDRIRKMHAKAESSKELGLDHEALAFASAVKSMLLKHNLEMSDIEAFAEEQADPIKAHYFDPRSFGLPRSKVRVAWTENLARVIARAHMCDLIAVRASNKLMLIGSREHRQICEFMIVTLTRYAIEHSEKDYVKFFYRCRDMGDVTQARGYKAGWLMGFVGRLAERYSEDEHKTRAEYAEGPNKHALIRLDKQLVRLQDAKDQISKALEAKKSAVPQGRRAADSGVEDGASQADRVNLDGTGIGKASDRRAVGAGQRQLGSGV